MNNLVSQLSINGYALQVTNFHIAHSFAEIDNPVKMEDETVFIPREKILLINASHGRRDTYSKVTFNISEGVTIILYDLKRELVDDIIKRFYNQLFPNRN